MAFFFIFPAKDNGQNKLKLMIWTRNCLKDPISGSVLFDCAFGEFSNSLNRSTTGCVPGKAGVSSDREFL